MKKVLLQEWDLHFINDCKYYDAKALSVNLIN